MSEFDWINVVTPIGTINIALDDNIDINSYPVGSESPTSYIDRIRCLYKIDKNDENWESLLLEKILKGCEDLVNEKYKLGYQPGVDNLSTFEYVTQDKYILANFVSSICERFIYEAFVNFEGDKTLNLLIPISEVNRILNMSREEFDQWVKSAPW